MLGVEIWGIERARAIVCRRNSYGGDEMRIKIGIYMGGWLV